MRAESRSLCVYALVFWVIIPCSDVVGYHRLGGPSRLHLHGVHPEDGGRENLMSRISVFV
jgi:hypothetical protein